MGLLSDLYAKYGRPVAARVERAGQMAAHDTGQFIKSIASPVQGVINTARALPAIAYGIKGSVTPGQSFQGNIQQFNRSVPEAQFATQATQNLVQKKALPRLANTITKGGELAGGFAIPVPGVGQIKALEAARPLAKLAGYTAARAGEGYAYGAGTKLAETGNFKEANKAGLFGAATGGIGNVLLSPKLAKSAVKDVGSLVKETGAANTAYRTFKAVPNETVPIQAPGGYAPGTVTRPKELQTIDVPADQARAMIKPGDVKGISSNARQGTVRVSIDPTTKQVASWDSQNPYFIKEMTGGASIQPGRVGKPNTKQQAILEAKQQERGFVTSGKESDFNAQVKEALKGDYTVKKNTKLLDEVGQTIQKEGTYKLQERLLSTPTRNINDKDVASAITLAQLHNSEGNFAQAANLINNLAPKLTEAGRTVQAASLLNKLSPEGVQYIAAKELSKIGRELDPVTARSLAEKSKAIRSMGEGREKNIAVNGLMTDIANLVPTSGWQKLVTVWKAGLLTSPRTTLRNVVGNTLNAGAEMIKDPFAAGADKLLSLRTGERSVTSTLRGAGSGAVEGLAKSKDVLKYGFDPNGAAGKFDVNHITWGNNPVEKGLKAYTEGVFRFLEAQDKPFYESSFKRSLYDQAGAQTINAGKRGDMAYVENLVKNPNENMLITAHNDASVATFKNKTVATKVINDAKKAARDYSPAAGAALDFIAPFTGVPTSVGAQMAAYSPYGLGKGLIRAAKVAWKGEAGNIQRQASQEIGRGIVGTGVLALGAELARRGLMTGDYPTNEREQEQWKLEGKQPNSILVGGKWRQVSSLGPQASVLLVGGKSGEKGRTNVKGDPVNKVFDTAAFGLKTLSDSSFLQGVQGVLDAVNDPTRNASRFVNSSISGVVPNAFRDIGRGSDTDENGNMIQRETNNPWQAFANGVPGLRQKQLPQRDVFGQQVTTGKGFPTNAVDIFNSQPAKKDPVIDELRRLMNTENPATPTKLNDIQSAFGTKFSLTKEQLDSLEQKAGSDVREKLATLMQSPLYQQTTDEEKAKVINNLVSDTRTNTKNGVLLSGQANGSLKVVPPKNAGTTKIATKNSVPNSSDTLFNYFTPVSSSNQSVKPPTKTELDIARYQVANGQKDQIQLGDTVVVADPTSPTGYQQYSLNKIKQDVAEQEYKLKLDAASRAKDTGAWLQLQQQQLDTLAKQNTTLNPAFEQAKILANQNAMADIQNQIARKQSVSSGRSRRKLPRVRAPRVSFAKTSNIKVRSSKPKSIKVRKPKKVSFKS